jgi:uncharacterized protein (TIGR02996 family)
MIDATALLEAIAQDPGNDLPRLIYADWLEDQDQPRLAEFIRLQCEIAKLEVQPRAVINENVAAWRRQQELLDDHLAELWPAGLTLPQPGARYRFHRGFLDELDLLPGDYLAQPEALAGLRPSPTSLSLACQERDFPLILETLRRTPIPLTELQLTAEDDEFGSSTASRLVDRTWPELRTLRLTQTFFQADAEGFAVALPSRAPRLTALHWTSCYLSDEVLFALLNSGLLQQLSTINLRHNRLTDQAAFELADRLVRSAKLRHLNVSNNPISSSGQSALLAAFGSRVDLF